MPLPVGAPVPPQQTGQPDTPIFDLPKAWWIDPSGGEWPLMDETSGWWTTNAGIKGMGAVAPLVFTNDPVARGGTKVRWIQPDARTITWPLRVEGCDHAEFVANWRNLARAFTKTRRLGPGQLIVSRPDGSARQIDAYYQEGFEEAAGAGMSAVWFDAVSLSLYCPDPYWRSLYPIEIERHYQPSGPATPFLNPYPFVTSTLVLGDSTVNNPGDVECYPDFIITGPASGITATNNTTGGTWSMDPNTVLGRALAADEVITITGNPPMIAGPAGGLWQSAIDWSSSDLWWLEPGFNDVTLSLASPGAGSNIAMSFYPRYETA